MTIPNLPAYVPSFRPLTQIQPFTYRDGLTYLEKLDDMSRYINMVVVPFINDNFDELGDEFVAEVNRMIAEVEAQLTAQTEAVSEQLETQNTAITEQLAEQNESLETSITAIESQMTALQTTVNNQLDAMQEYVDEQVGLIIGESVELNDTIFNTLIQDTDSDSRTTLDGLYSVSTVGDPVVAGFVNDTGSDTRTAVDDAISDYVTSDAADTQLASIVSDDTSDLHEALDNEYGDRIVALEYKLRAVANLTALNGLTGMVQGDRVRVIALGIDFDYYEAYNAGTNPLGTSIDGTPVAGWFPAPGSNIFSVLTYTGAINNASTAILGSSTFPYTEEFDGYGFHSTNDTKILPILAGYYDLAVTAAWTAEASGQRLLYARRNGVSTPSSVIPGGDVDDLNNGVESLSEGRTRAQINNVKMNGSTDYFDTAVYQSRTSAGTNTVYLRAVVKYLGPPIGA